MNLTFSVHQSFAAMPIDWKQHLNDDTICKGIDMVENAHVPDLKNFYLVTYDNLVPVYVSYYQLLSVRPKHFNIADKKLQQAALSLALKLVKPTLLVAGNLFRHDVLFFFFLDDKFTLEEKAHLYQATTNHLIKHTNASGIFLKDVDPSIAPFIQKDESFLQMPDDVSMEIKIPKSWETFEDYEKALKHKYVQRCRKIRKSFQDIKTIEFDLELIEKYCKEMELLYLKVTQKQMVSMGTINDLFFIELKKSFGDHYKVFGFFLEDKLVGFSSAILHHDEYDMNYIGIDYSYNASHNLYFNILFHCVESAIAMKSKNLILGRTALEAKAIMGCEPDYRFSFYKLRNVIVNWFYKMVATNFREGQGEKWKDRHPFKSNHYQEL